jgi:hypothetical protein
MYQSHDFDFHKNTIAFGDCQCECFAFFATPAAAQRMMDLTPKGKYYGEGYPVLEECLSVGN